jgi:predicted GNAT family acetyltransferase
MTDRDKANHILKKMQEAGYEVVDSCESWNDDEVDYFVVNYLPYYPLGEDQC